MVKKKLVKDITSMDDDFAQWYTDIVKRAELIDYSTVKGCMIIRPYGYAIWENIKNELDKRLKETGHDNVYMPLFIPETLLQKEKDHIEGFAPEVAWITHAGDEKLSERLCVRPTSETLFCEHFSKIIQSYNDLPKLYNQWCSVVRCEKTTRPFLRTTEFLWQEGHTVHATEQEAELETIKMLDLYENFCNDILAIPVIKGKKTEKEKFAGAKATYTIESLMHDGKALQTGTSHNFSDNFAKAFNIQYTDNDGKLKYAFQTSWGVTTRLIGAIIMVHGDDNGLVLPPKIAPIQIIIVPIAQHKNGVLEKAYSIQEKLSKKFRVKIDDTEKMPGWKFSEYEMKGIPIRIEIGPKDIENNQAILVRRDTGEKMNVSLDELEENLIGLLDKIHKSMLDKARLQRERKTFLVNDLKQFIEVLNKEQGFIKAMWCGKRECEDKIKEYTGATSRCIVDKNNEDKADKICVCCGEKAKHMVYWGKAY